MKNTFKDLATSLDVLNTLHGGVSEPVLSIREDENGREIRVRIPGVDKELIQAEIVNNNELSLFYIIPVYSSGSFMQIPQVIFHQPMPPRVEVNNIKATYEGNELVVKLPFSELSDGNHRRVEIGKD
jgi:HSP20 family molecular chaperone IbpA